MIFPFYPVERDSVPSKGGTLFDSAPAACVLFKDSTMPGRPIIGVLRIAQLRCAKALAIGGPDTGYMQKGPLVTELAPEVPVFHDGKLLIEVRVDSTHCAASEQHGMDWQIVDAP